MSTLSFWNLHWACFSLLKGRESDGYAENQEQLIRAVLKEFPYVECQLLQQMIRTITSTPPEVVNTNVHSLVMLDSTYRVDSQGPSFKLSYKVSQCLPSVSNIAGYSFGWKFSAISKLFYIIYLFIYLIFRCILSNACFGFLKRVLLVKPHRFISQLVNKLVQNICHFIQKNHQAWIPQTSNNVNGW